MIKATTHNRLGTKLHRRPPRRLTADTQEKLVPTSRVSSNAVNPAALSRQHPDMNGKQPDPAQAPKDRAPLPKRWCRGHDLRSIHHRSNTGRDTVQTGIGKGYEKSTEDGSNMSPPSNSYTEDSPIDSQTHQDLQWAASESVTVIESRVNPSLPVINKARARASLAPLNTVRGRQQQLLDLEAQQKRTAIERYKATGDTKHFLPFLGPFMDTEDGDNKAEPDEWQWDEETERYWRRGGKDAGTRIWAPVKESFI